MSEVRTLNDNYHDDPETGLVLPSRRTRRNIVVVTLFVMWAIIWYVVTQGDPSNSLHQSALSWGVHHINWRDVRVCLWCSSR